MSKANAHLRSGTILIFSLLLSSSQVQDPAPDYHFRGQISEEVLRAYLDRAITMAEVCTSPKFKVDGQDAFEQDNIRLIRNTGAKFIGRAIFRWGSEHSLNDPEFWSHAEKVIAQVHAFDEDVIFQAAVFEAVTQHVKLVPVPERVFQAFGLPLEKRNFSYKDMLFSSGRYQNHWGEGTSVPDITQRETKLWFYYLATSYIEAGIEAIHWGQVALMGAGDPDLRHWFEMTGLIRDYARDHARRHFILHDAHAPEGGFKSGDRLLMDFHSFPLRIKSVEDEAMKGILEVGHLDAIYHRSMGGLTASGWTCEHLPYLVEFDNFGISNHPGRANNRDHYIWGYDEISWFSLLSPEEQKKWLEYAYTWVKKTDSDGYLQMPVCRVVSNGKDPVHKYKAHIKSEVCPGGTGLEAKIKELWSSPSS